jgi:hypothetical protein
LNAAAPNLAWIKPLAAPYLRGFRPRVQRKGPLRGCWFKHSKSPKNIAFFVGYLVEPDAHAYLKSILPECLVFASIQPSRGALHRRLVDARDSLFRKTFEYIRWLTHRHPRFEFYPSEETTLVRRVSMRDWPTEKVGHYSRNFFIETLCWLVRSALVRRLLAEGNSQASARRTQMREGRTRKRRTAA